ncbi:MAG: Ldh family oxidoreductase [Chloroflexi bacterium]|nr:MAG: Ldh family oxidoreductase [Chloroflexota bacterium]
MQGASVTAVAEARLFPPEQLFEFSVRVFTHLGVPEEDARTAATVLQAADLRGIDSHGVARLHSYFELLQMGRIDPKANVTIVRESPSTATVDGGNGLGLVVGPKANAIAMEKADANGSGWVSVRNTNHFGIAGYYVLEALKRDLIGWAMTNTTKLVAPLWGAERMLGTNPIAIAFPGLEEPDIVIDMATTAAAYGKIEIARRAKKLIPPGWAIDRNGAATTDPNAMIDGGAMLPLGSDRDGGGHKGYGLAVMVDVLSAMLSGANWGPFVPPFALRQEMPARSVGKGTGHFFGALRIDAFIDKDEFKRQIDDFIRTLRKTRPAPGTAGPLIPGDPEREAEAIRRREGIPLVGAVVEELRDISKQTGIPL